MEFGRVVGVITIVGRFWSKVAVGDLPKCLEMAMPSKFECLS